MLAWNPVPPAPTDPATPPTPVPHPPGEVVRLNTYCPWKEHLHQLEEEMGCAGTIKYVVYEVSTPAHPVAS